MKKPNETPEDSVTLGTNSASPKSACGRILRQLVSRYQSKRKPISVNFRRMIPCPNWHDRLAHLIHPYPAKLLVHIPFFFLNNDLLSEAGDLVLDPFCGSGTVLSEAQSAGRVGFGADANPLARLVARVKTTRIEPARIRQQLRWIIRNIEDENPRDLPDVVNINHWF